jgi:hypothetical protein
MSTSVLNASSATATKGARPSVSLSGSEQNVRPLQRISTFRRPHAPLKDIASFPKKSRNLYAKIGWEMLEFAYSLIRPAL